MALISFSSPNGKRRAYGREPEAGTSSIELLLSRGLVTENDVASGKRTFSQGEKKCL